MDSAYYSNTKINGDTRGGNITFSCPRLVRGLLAYLVLPCIQATVTQKEEGKKEGGRNFFYFG
jgi:hypothetical protein